MPVKKTIRVFFAHPGDTEPEFQSALRIIDDLNHDMEFSRHIVIEPIAWDKPGDRIPFVMSKTAQQAVDSGQLRPSQCDIVIVLFAGRMGTPLNVDDHGTKDDGTPYLSGTEWEFEEAMRGNKRYGRPEIIIFRRMDYPTIQMGKPGWMESVRQYQRVQKFFKSFNDKDGAIKRGYEIHKNISEFSEKFPIILRKLCQRIFDGFDTPQYERVKKILDDPNTRHIERELLGTWLLQNNDGRPGVGLAKNGLPQIEWCSIPAGTIRLGEKETPFGRLSNSDTPVRDFSVSAFQMSKYPITWTQWSVFMRAPDGYYDEQWWSVKSRFFSREPISHPIWNHPAHNINWFEAMAFCRWLTAKYSEFDNFLYSEKVTIRLLTEWEWQLGAVGENKFVYPWGNEWQGSHANTYESGLRRPVAVGLYPLGASTFGVEDMVGNVREWCFNDSYYNIDEKELAHGRVVRGGSYESHNDGTATAAWFPSAELPYDCWLDIGFRVVCVPQI